MYQRVKKNDIIPCSAIIQKNEYWRAEMDKVERRDLEERKRSFEINYEENDKFLKISFEEENYAISFFEHGSVIQELLESGKYHDYYTDKDIILSDVNQVVIDFSKTVWFDTLALCYLFLFIYDSIAKYDDKPKYRFICPTDAKFTAFLRDNGFVSHMSKLDPDVEKSLRLDDSTYSTVHRCFFPFDVFNKREDIPAKLENMQLRMENAFSNFIEPERLEYLINKISYFMHETMENVFDHAYVNPGGRCGLLVKSVNCNNGINYTSYSKKYTSKTPYIKINMFEDSDAYLEVYVLDTGRGLKKSFSPDNDITDDNIISYIFEDGRRSYRKVKQGMTRYGGLHDIKELFEQDADGLGIKADNVWRYVYKYSKKRDTQRISNRVEYGNYDGLIHGFSLVASIHLPKVQSSENEGVSSLKEMSSRIVEDLFDQTKGIDILSSAVVLDERWGETINHKWMSNKKFIAVIYPPAVSTKAWIINTIYENKNDSLVFLEVPDAEIKKYQSNIEGVYAEKVSLKKIIVVTKSLNISYYVVGTDGHFFSSEEFRERYIRKVYSKELSIIESFSTLLIFDKYYNSWRFWDLALNISDGFTYIPEKVFWSREKSLTGYLDFSQTNRIPECRDICIQKLNQLRVLISGAYFNSVDRFTDEICERANFVVGGDKEGVKINIGSIFVSGTSNRLLDNDIECFYFFSHPDSDNVPVKNLLSWLSPQLLPEINNSESEERKFRRMGNSSFIARGGTDYWFKKHYGKMDSSIRLSEDLLYSLLQRKIGVHPDTLRIGHFESTERHDLFGYRINYWFDSDVIDRLLLANYSKASVFDYLFTNIIYALKGKIDKEEFFNTINPTLSNGVKDSLWSKYKGADDCVGRDRDGILVYFYDFQTSMLVEKIEKLLAKVENRRVIPLIPLSRTYEMGSLMISPLVLDRIERQIMDIKGKGLEARITIFESVAFNVRLVEEIKQILYGLGASTVRVLTILDRRRIPVTETKPSLKALGRIDSPALHGNDRCTICKATELLEKCKNQVINSDIKKQIGDIISRWQYIQLSDNEYMRGIGSKKINLTQNAKKIISNYCGKYMGKDLRIELDSALCSMVVEHSVISASNQLLLLLLNENDLIENDIEGIASDELKMLLASTYLLLFATNPVSNKQIRLVVEKLRDLLDNYKYVSDSTSLAVIAISSLPDRFVDSLCKKYESIEREEDCSISKTLNIDALICRLVSYMITQLPNGGSKYPLLERLVRCHFAGNQSKLECLYDIFMYTEISYDNSHRHAFARIIEKSAPTPRDYQNALDYSKKIEDTISNDDIYASLFHDKSILSKNKEDIIKKTQNAIEVLDKMISYLAVNNEIDPKLTNAVRESVEDYIQSLALLNSKSLYLRISSLGDSEEHKAIEVWLKYCLKIAKSRVRNCDDASFCFDVQKTATIPKRWFYSFSDVTEEVINLMVDILQYQDGAFLWEKDGKKALYNGVITIEYNERYAEITFINKTNRLNSIEKIRDIKKSKSNRDSLLVFKEFYRILNEDQENKQSILEWEYSDNVNSDLGAIDNYYYAIMRIPYINRGSSYKLDVFERGEQ